MPNRPATQNEPQPNKREPEKRVAGIFARRPPVAAPKLAFEKRVSPAGLAGAGDDSWSDGKALSESENFDGAPKVNFTQLIDYNVQQAFLDHQAWLRMQREFDKPHVTFQTFDASSGYTSRAFPWPFADDLGECAIENFSNQTFAVYLGEVVSGIPYTVVPPAPTGGFVLKWFPTRDHTKMISLVPTGTPTQPLGQVTVWFENRARTPGVSIYTPVTGTSASQASGNSAVALANVQVKASAGRVFYVTVTTAYTGGPATLQDGIGGGAVVLSIPTAVGTYTYPGLVFNTGIWYAFNGATTGAANIGFA